jgi:hypothetical protein
MTGLQTKTIPHARQLRTWNLPPRALNPRQNTPNPVADGPNEANPAKTKPRDKMALYATQASVSQSDRQVQAPPNIGFVWQKQRFELLSPWPHGQGCFFARSRWRILASDCSLGTSWAVTISESDTTVNSKIQVTIAR